MIDPDDPEPNVWTDWIKLAQSHAPDEEVPSLDPSIQGQDRSESLAWVDKVVSNFAAQSGFVAATMYEVSDE